MSGEYILINAASPMKESKLIEDKSVELVDKICQHGGDCPTANKQDNLKLYEVGEVIEMAETRCHTLKEQLDHMKMLYKQKHVEVSRRSFEKNYKSIRNSSRNRNLLRQNSGAIGTDNSGAAVVTINNILSGITNSINRLSELHQFMEVDQPLSRKTMLRDIYAANTERVRCVTVATDIRDDGSQQYLEAAATAAPPHRKSHKRRGKRISTHSIGSSGSYIVGNGKERSKSRLKKCDSKGASSTSVKKRKRVKRLNKSSRASVRDKKEAISAKPFQIPKSSNRLVEIYHNAAARDSESEDHASNSPDAEKLTKFEMRYMAKKIEIVPPINLHTPHYANEVGDEDDAFAENKTLSPIEENVERLRTECTIMSHNYEAPTIASRMKQVAKGYFRQYNSKTIPFCAAKSTTPSHNIGINIQQVMNIIKTRQPLKDISPTLAHNIGLAAERLQHHSICEIVSSLGSRIGWMLPNFSHSTMTCPMIRNNINFEQMQEMAKNMPDLIETDEGIDTKTEEEITEPKTPDQQSVWTVNQNNCTCIPRQGVGFQQILNKYHQPSQPIANLLPLNQYSQKIMKQSMNKYKHVRSVYAEYNKFRKLDKDPSGESMPLKGKEKILKGVLLNLHNEFGALSECYDNLVKTLNKSKDDMSHMERRELEALEKKINDKEEEIQMVMGLYNEVVNLKQQVKVLKEKASLASIMVEQQKQQFQLMNQNQVQTYNFSKNDNTTAVHLTKLLRQIQNYKQVQKNGGK